MPHLINLAKYCDIPGCFNQISSISLTASRKLRFTYVSRCEYFLLIFSIRLFLAAKGTEMESIFYCRCSKSLASPFYAFAQWCPMFPSLHASASVWELFFFSFFDPLLSVEPAVACPALRTANFSSCLS